MGIQYWSQLASEHGIQSDGTCLEYPSETTEFQTNHPSLTPNNRIRQRSDRTDVFFTSNDQNKYTPRAILIDLEPSVIGRATNAMPMFNPRNTHLSNTGSGAANNWKRGYNYGQEHAEELINMIDREIDKCDNLSAFQLFHSVAGGTGSGVGSLLMEILNDRYGSKKILSTFLVFPSSDKTSDVVVQPYNTVLTLKRLIDFSDATFVFDNDSLNSLESTFLPPDPNRGLSLKTAFDGANKLISFVACGVSNPLRFPGYMYSSYESIISTLVPTPDLKFLSSAIAPYSQIPGASQGHNYVSLNEYDIVLELLNNKYKMNRTSEVPKYISMFDYLISSSLNQQEIRRGVIRAQQRVEFVPWASSSIHVVNGRKSPFTPKAGISGFQISNNTSNINMLTKILRQYDLLAKRSAYLNYYTESNDPAEKSEVLEMFNESKESILSVIEEYKQCNSMSYLEDDILDEEMMT